MARLGTKTNCNYTDTVHGAGYASTRVAGNLLRRQLFISFRADDGKGGSCTGAVTVGVPFSQKKGLIAIDDGQVYDSTLQ
jgi:hypothetical protein